MPKYQTSPIWLRSKNIQDRRQKYSKISFKWKNKEYRLKILTLADAELGVIWSAEALGCLSRPVKQKETFPKEIVQLVQTGSFCGIIRNINKIAVFSRNKIHLLKITCCRVRKGPIIRPALDRWKDFLKGFFSVCNTTFQYNICPIKIILLMESLS